MKPKLILIFVFCISSITSYSQELNLFLQDIKEERLNGQTQRSTSDSINNITFTTAVNGIALDDYHFVKLGKLKVVDETGKSLKEIKGPFYKNDTYKNNKRMEFTVEAPIRQVTKIKTFEGSLLYFTPTEANGGKIIIRDFLQRKDENLLADSYPEIDLQLMDTDKLLDVQEEMQKMIDARVEKRKKESPISDKEQEEINQARQLLDRIMGLTNRSSVYKTLTFQLNQKLNEAFYRMDIYNENDKKVSSGYSSVDNIYQFHLTEQPTKGCYIEILIENKNAVKELPFQFNNTVLP
ncbi:hypothetical protein [Sinomicrobium sp. M5D2P9]